MRNTSYLHNAHPDFIETLYKDYKADPESVDPGWRKFFEGFELGQGSAVNGAAKKSPEMDGDRRKEVAVLRMIEAYRSRGHLFTKTNPVRERRRYRPTLALENFELTESDLDTVFEAGREIGIGPAPLRDIVEHLVETYTGAMGAEYRFIRHPDRIKWLQDRMESTRNEPNFSLDEKRYILEKLNQAVAFENFLHTKYVGQKRFSLSGGESLIPALDAVIEKGAALGAKEFVIGMAHRGRLNVLANIIGKSYEDIFAEFEGAAFEDGLFEGDVKYHLGFSSNRMTRVGKNVHLSIIPNPSHLEAVDPVTEGVVRAKIDKRYNGDANKIVPILIHGDAAIAGQGIAYEVIQMSLLEGYRTGGTIHLVINNQVGFTTNYIDGRSSTYCTDVAKVTLSPVFHVNGDDVEEVVHAIVMAMEYRQRFNTDVFIDILGYRKYGHNESDEPRFTQPTLYKSIARHPDPAKIYREKLLAEGSIDQDTVSRIEKDFHNLLETNLDEARDNKFAPEISTFKADWTGFRKPADVDFTKRLKTAVDKNTLDELAEQIFTVPEDLPVFNKIRRLYNDRMSRYKEGKRIDWAVGEALAYAAILNDGSPIRLSGQDCERGTFSHRHAVLQLDETDEEYVPLNNIRDGQPMFQAFNSLLSEYAVLGFEYGYASAHPKGLTIWEAQFGDFANGAQIIIDQFLSCSEAKWRRYNGLVLFLPHGYEGQGPEHSSARMERFLALCAHNNMFALNCTTPANFFHALRRQIVAPYRMPAVVFTPKSLLRHPLCVSSLKEFTDGTFKEIIDDPAAKPADVKKILFCNGKIYYDLLAKKTEDDRKDVAIVRLEQLHPFPKKQLEKIVKRYKNADKYFWVQEEPENMGAWSYFRRKCKIVRADLISRDASSTPATGFYKTHMAEQQEIIDLAFDEITTHKMRVGFYDQDEV